MIFDTNVYLDLCFDPKEKLIRLASENTLVAPNFLKLEIINVLRKYHFLKSIPIEILEKYEQFTFELVDVFVPDFELLDAAKRFSYHLNHPIYDCIFLALADETKDTFCSYDQKLLKKAESIGIKTMGFSN